MELLEPTGSDTWGAGDIDGRELTGLAKGRSELAVGSVALFAINIDNLHLFDQETEQAIV